MTVIIKINNVIFFFFFFLSFIIRIKDKIWDEEQKKAGELAGCRVNLQAVKNWIDLRDKELESMDPIGNDLKTLSQQREDLKVW